MSAAAPLLEVEGITKRFGGLTALSEVSFAIRPGEIYGLIGPNGAGKTTLFNVLTGLYRHDEGHFRFQGLPLEEATPDRIAALGIARTFQHGELFPRMTVLENLLVARHARMRTGAIAESLFLRSVRDAEVEHRRAVEGVIEFVELERYRHQPVDALPFGIQKVVGFARALAMAPQVLLLDEPSAGLNRDEREDLARHILRIRHELGLAMVWVEHDMQMVADLADRIHVLDYGRTLAEGAAEAVLADPKVVEAYLGSAEA
jgi:branched-chain amino acid transport system ATP-binding protein